MRIKTHQKKSTFVTLISEENETRNKNPANFFTLQNFLAGTEAKVTPKYLPRATQDAKCLRLEVLANKSGQKKVHAL